MFNSNRSEYLLDIIFESLFIKVSFDCEVSFLILSGSKRIQSRFNPFDRKRSQVILPPEVITVVGQLNEKGSIALGIQLLVSAMGKSRQGGQLSVEIPVSETGKQQFSVPLSQCPDPRARVNFTVSCRKQIEKTLFRRGDSVTLESANRSGATSSIKLPFSKTNLFNKDQSSSAQLPRVFTNIFDKMSASARPGPELSQSTRQFGNFTSDRITDFNKAISSFDLNSKQELNVSQQTALKPKLFHPGYTTSSITQYNTGKAPQDTFSISNNTLINAPNSSQKTSTVLSSSTKSKNIVVSFREGASAHSSTAVERYNTNESLARSKSPKLYQSLLRGKKDKSISNVEEEAQISERNPQASNNRPSITQFQNSARRISRKIAIFDLPKIFERTSSFQSEIKALEAKIRSQSELEKAEQLQLFETKIEELRSSKRESEISLAAAIAESSKLKSQLDSLEFSQSAEIERSKNELLQLTLNFEQMKSTLSHEKEDLSNQVSELSSKLFIFQSEQKNQENSSSDLISSIENWKAKCFEVEFKLNKELLENQELRALSVKVENRYKEEISKLQIEIQELRKQIEASLSAQKQESSGNSNPEFQKISQNLTETQNRLLDTQKELTEVEKKLSETERKLSEAEKRAKEAQEKLTFESTASGSLSTRLVELNSTIGELNQKIESLQKIISDKSEELEMAPSSSKGLQKKSE